MLPSVSDPKGMGGHIKTTTQKHLNRTVVGISHVTKGSGISSQADPLLVNILLQLKRSRSLLPSLHLSGNGLLAALVHFFKN